MDPLNIRFTEEWKQIHTNIVLSVSGMSSMSNQTDLGHGVPSSLQRTGKRYVSPNSEHELRFTEPLSTKKRKTTSPLTPDNVATVLGNAFDLPTFADTLAKDTSIIHDEQSLFSLMTKCVVDLTVSQSSRLTLYVCSDSSNRSCPSLAFPIDISNF